MAGKPQSLSKGQREEVIQILKAKLGKWFLIGLTVLTLFTGLSLWQIFKRINVKIEEILTEQFEEPRIVQIVNEAASNRAGEMMAEEIQPEVNRFREEVSQELADLQSFIDSTMQLAAPPILEFYADSVIHNDSNIVAFLRFEPSKNEPLGMIEFHIEILEPSSVRILDIWPDVGSHAFGSGDDSKQIGENQLNARLIYTIMGVGWPTFKLTLSAPATVRIDGNYILEPVELRIE